MAVESIKIENGKFYINGIMSNHGNHLSEGRLVGIYTDMCGFFDKAVIDIFRNKKEFINNLSIWKNSNINLITAALQSPNPFGEYYKKAREQNKNTDFSHVSSAIKSDGSLDLEYLLNIEDIIITAGNLGFTVLVNILNASCENIFQDEFSILNGIFNAVDWLEERSFPNVLVNITDISHTFYKSSVLNGDRFIKVFKSIKNKVKDHLIVSAGIKSFANVSPINMDDYIKSSDFIPIYAKPNHNTKKMLENIYFFKEEMGKIDKKLPLIMVKGDDLDEKYNSYGKNNLIEALENGISWCYYDLDGFVILPVSWDKNSSNKKINFFREAENI
ncbi:MAG: hypothetical protein FWD71_09840 [Oscillospiraceae bacterium]|nr:hypothetical protein [Oscillospiraceae bacterium]